MKLKGLTRRPKAVRYAAVEPEMIPTLLEKKPERKPEVVDEDFPELKNIPTVMSFRSTDSMDDMDRGPLRYAPTDKSHLDKYWGSVEGLGMTSSDSTGEPVWTHPASNDDDDRDWYPEKNSFDHYEERIAAARKQMNKDGIILPPSLWGTWSECDTLQTSPSEERSTKENEGTHDEQPSGTSPGSPLNEKQKEKSRSTPALFKSVLKKRSPVAVEATSPPSSPKRQPSTETTVAESKKPIPPDNPKAHSSAKVLAAGSTAAVVAGLQATATISPSSTSTKSKASLSTQSFASAGAANQSPTSISTKSKAKDTVSSKDTSQWKETDSKNPVEITTPRKEAVVVVPTQSSTKSNVEKKDHSTGILGRARLFSLRRKPWSSQKANSSVSSKDSHEVASTPTSDDPMNSAPNLVKSPTSDSREAGSATASVPSAAVANPQAHGSPSKERALQNALKKDRGLSGAPMDASSGPLSAITPSNAITSKDSDVIASNLPPASTLDFSASPHSPTSPTASLTLATASKNSDTTSNFPPAASAVASVAALAGLMHYKGKTKGDTNDTAISGVKQTKKEAGKVKEAAKLGCPGMNNITDKMISIGAAKVKSEARKEANQKSAAKTNSDAPEAGSLEKKEQVKDVSEAKAEAEAKKKDSHETHRNMRFWKKRAGVNKTGLLWPEGANEELTEDSTILKTIAEVNSTDNIMPKTMPVHGSSNDFTTPTVEASMFKSDAAEAFLRQIQCGCLADCIVNNKDAKWDGATSKAVAFSKLELDDEMDIDQAVAAMRRSKRNEPMPIKFIEFPKDDTMTATSSVTDSQAAVIGHKPMSASWSKSNDSGTSVRAKTILQKLGKSSRRSNESQYY